LNEPTPSWTLELAAHLGDPEAMLALRLSSVDPEGFEAWAWGFSRFGKPTMLRAALVAAKLALPVWTNYQADDPLERELFGGSLLAQAIAFASSRLDPTAAPDAEAIGMLAALRERVAQASSYVEEASGGAERVMARERAVAAASTALEALEVLAWTDAAAAVGTHEALDPVELRARIAAGPAVHVVRSFAFACLATGADSARLRALLRAELLAP
jgi:hypothetical protein